MRLAVTNEFWYRMYDGCDLVWWLILACLWLIEFGNYH